MARDFKTFVIANPKAGSSTVKKEWSLIERHLRNALQEFDVAFTNGPGHATLLAREALKAGWEMVVAVGGDGTLNEVINGFVDKAAGDDFYSKDENGWLVHNHDPLPLIREDAVLGVIPMGTGGDFRRSLGWLDTWKDAVNRLTGQETMPVDLGQLGFINHDGDIAHRMFLNIASAGISGKVDERVNNSWKGLGGTASFIYGFLSAYSGWKNADIMMRFDDVDELRESVLNLIVANGQYFGGGMWAAPGAKIDDGLFEIVVMGDMPRLRALPELIKIYNGTHLRAEKIWRRAAHTVASKPANNNDQVLLDVDGEQPGQLPATWNMHAKAIRLKIGPTGTRK